LRKRVAIVDLGMNEKRDDGLSSGIVKSVPDSTKVTNRWKARFRYG